MSRTICLDANLVVWWLNRSDHPHVADRIRSALDEGIRLVAPGLMRYEVTNVIYQALKTRNIDASTADAMIDAAIALPVDLVHEGLLHGAALSIAHRFRIRATYDAHYVALAQHLGAELWTADKHLYNAVQHHLDFVQLVEPT